MDEGKILINSRPLLEDYDIGRIIDREEPKERIFDLVINPLLREEEAASVYVYGPPGTGKTFVVEKLLKENYNKIKLRLPTFELIWLNCKAERTTYVTLVHIAKHLEKYLPIGGIDKIPWKGLDYGVLMNDIVKRIVEKKNLELLIVLDEVDEIVYRDGDAFLYDLIYANKFLERGHIYLIAISNDPNLESMFSAGVSDRLRYLKIHFPKYNANELFEILKAYAEICLKENSYELRDLALISKHVSSVSGSAREAKRILYFLARKSDSKLDISKLNEAIEESEKLMFQRDIETLPFHQKLSLLAVIKSYENFQRSMNKMGLKRFLSFPNTGKVYDCYKQVCYQYGEKPKSLTAFKYMLKDLDRIGLINIDIKSFGRRGLTSVITPLKPVDIIKPMVEEAIRRVVV